ncbi:MAG TPA: EAL domain-containing protein [Steroidobacter sp.]
METVTPAVVPDKLGRELRTAARGREFALHYQPKIRLETGELEGVEALLRWRRGSGAWVSPAAFTPMLERMGLIEEVGHWIFEQAAADCEYWLASGRCARRVAINVSPLQLRDRQSLASMLQVCSGWRVPGTGLDLELTESALIEESDELIAVLEELSAANVIVALDDFGCGYSSLSRLSRLPVRHLKIDRSFTAQLGTNPRARLIVEAIIRLGRALGMEVVAEGIETREQLSLLRSLGCTTGQGFFFSPALTREDLLPFLPCLSPDERPS